MVSIVIPIQYVEHKFGFRTYDFFPIWEVLQYWEIKTVLTTITINIFLGKVSSSKICEIL